MSNEIIHPLGESQNSGELVPAEGPLTVDTFGGKVHVDWNPDCSVPPSMR